MTSKLIRYSESRRVIPRIVLGGRARGILTIGCWFLLDEGLRTAPEAQDAILGRSGRCACLFCNVIFLVGLRPGRVRLLSRPVGQLGGALCRRDVTERHVFGLRAEAHSIVLGGAAVVLFGDRIALFAVLPQELEEALVAADLDAGDLEGVPRLVEKRLDVAHEHGEGSFVHTNAIPTKERAKSDVAMAASIVLAVDAESIELLFVDALAKVCTDLRALDITTKIGFG